MLSPVVEVRQEVPFLPKVAFTLISLASLAGAVFTGLHLGLSLPALLLRWLLLWLLALALGFSAWRTLYLREEKDLGAEAQAFLAEEQAVWKRLAQPLGLVLVLLSPSLALFPYLGPAWGYMSLAQVFLGLGLWLGRPGLALGLSLALTLFWAERDTQGLWPSALRALHLSAFGLWLGGALFNLLVNVPVGIRHPYVQAVVAGARQLERFRFVVRLALPTLLFTGFFMAAGYRLPLEAWGKFPFMLIPLKLGFILALVVIFITCPLYRQCSPVRGVCNLDDLRVRPLKRLDNRKTPCALGLIRATEVMESLPSGTVLELLSRDVYAPYEVPAWALKYGYRLLKHERRGFFPFRYHRFWVEKP